MKVTINRDTALGVGVAVLVFALVFVLFAGPSGNEEVGQTDGITQYASGAAQVDIGNMTDQRAEYDHPYEIQYRGEPAWMSFQVSGIYFNQVFSGPYTDPAGAVVMNVTPHMTPGDGVPSIYLTPLYRPDEDKFEARVFMDQDFMDYTEGRIKALWGAQLYNASWIEPQEVVDGIYMATIDGPAYSPGVYPRPYRWAVGNFSTGPFSRPTDGVGVVAE